MKNIHIILSVLMLSIVLFSCDNEYEEPESFVDLSITWTSGASSNRSSAVDQFFSFSDLSAGAESTQWTIPDNAFFLQGPIPNNLDNHDEFIVNPGETVTNEKTIHVLWSKGDTNAIVNYRGVFPEYTSFDFNAYWSPELGSDYIDTIKTEMVDGKWVADYDFIIDVYDTIVAVAQVRYPDGTLLDHLNTGEVTVNLGDKLVFEDLSGLQPDNFGRPNTTLWRVHTLEEEEIDQTTVSRTSYTRGNILEQVIDTITFNDIGRFRVELSSIREQTEQVKTNRDVYDIPTIINVIE